MKLYPDLTIEIVNLKNWRRSAFLPCDKCGKFRQVAIESGKPSSSICRTCNVIKTHSHPNFTGMDKHRPMNQGELHPNWKGGVWNGKQYRRVFAPDHPNHSAKNTVKEHRLVMEKHLGRLLSTEEVVHHINGNRLDNRIENLMLFANNSEHIKFHRNQVL